MLITRRPHNRLPRPQPADTVSSCPWTLTRRTPCLSPSCLAALPRHLPCPHRPAPRSVSSLHCRTPAAPPRCAPPSRRSPRCGNPPPTRDAHASRRHGRAVPDRRLRPERRSLARPRQPGLRPAVPEPRRPAGTLQGALRALFRHRHERAVAVECRLRDDARLSPARRRHCRAATAAHRASSTTPARAARRSVTARISVRTTRRGSTPSRGTWTSPSSRRTPLYQPERRAIATGNLMVRELPTTGPVVLRPPSGRRRLSVRQPADFGRAPRHAAVCAGQQRRRCVALRADARRAGLGAQRRRRR